MDVLVRHAAKQAGLEGHDYEAPIVPVAVSAGTVLSTISVPAMVLIQPLSWRLTLFALPVLQKTGPSLLAGIKARPQRDVFMLIEEGAML